MISFNVDGPVAVEVGDLTAERLKSWIRFPPVQAFV